MSFIFVFDSTHHALTAEEALEESGLEIDIVPVPVDIRVDCGLAIEIAKRDREKAEAALDAAGVAFKAAVARRPAGSP